jgi:RHS repeat-associated protein
MLPCGSGQRRNRIERPAEHAVGRRAGLDRRIGAVRGGDGDGNVKQRGADYFTYDSQSRLTCMGTAATLCNRAQYRYEPLGDARTYEWTSAGERLYLGELFEWHKGSATSTMHVLVGGRRVASVERASDTLVAAWLPPFWEPPLPWSALRWGALGLLALALLALAIRLEVPAQAARRPLPVAVSLALALALVPGQAAMATPPPPSGVVKRWFVEDHLGSTALVLDHNANVVDRKVFEPFGKVHAQTSPVATSPRFTGKRQSAESGLYDFGARWYDPELGRFAQIDPIVQSPFEPVTLNAYAYAGNDPVNNVDPDGRGFFTNLFKAFVAFLPVLTAFVMPAILAPIPLSTAAGQAATAAQGGVRTLVSLSAAAGAGAGGASNSITLIGPAFVSATVENARSGGQESQGNENGVQLTSLSREEACVDFLGCLPPDTRIAAGGPGPLSPGLLMGVAYIAQRFGPQGWRVLSRFGDALKNLPRMSRSQLSGLQSHARNILDHARRLQEFQSNPTVRPGMEGLPRDVILRQQQIRVEHLRTEIRTFTENMIKILTGEQ